MAKKEQENAIIIANAAKFDTLILKNNVVIAMTGDNDPFGREYCCWYIVKKGNKFITYCEKNERPKMDKKSTKYWPKTFPITKVTLTIKESIDSLHKFGCEKFYLVKHYQASEVMDYNTVIQKI